MRGRWQPCEDPLPLLSGVICVQCPLATHSQPWRPEQGNGMVSALFPWDDPLHITFCSQFCVCVLAPPLTVTSGKKFMLPQPMVSSSVQWVQSSKHRPPWVESGRLRKQYVWRAHCAGITVSTLGGHLPFLWVCSEPQNLLQPQRFPVCMRSDGALKPPRELHWRGIEEWPENAPKPSVPPALPGREAWQVPMAGSRGEGDGHSASVPPPLSIEPGGQKALWWVEVVSVHTVGAQECCSHDQLCLPAPAQSGSQDLTLRPFLLGGSGNGLGGAGGRGGA